MVQEGFTEVEMARVTGLEPATSGVTGRHSNQLSYTRAFPSPYGLKRSSNQDLLRGQAKLSIILPSSAIHVDVFMV